MTPQREAELGVLWMLTQAVAVAIVRPDVCLEDMDFEFDGSTVDVVDLMSFGEDANAELFPT